jgi:hypothetical protein
MKKILSIIFVSCYFALSFATVAHAGPSCPAGSIIPCGCDKNSDKKIDSIPGPTGEACDFNDFIVLAQNVIEFLLFNIAAPIAAIMFAYAGFLYVTNGGNEGRVKQAHDIFWSVFLGLCLALAAYLIVWLLVNFFLDPSYLLLVAPR